MVRDCTKAISALLFGTISYYVLLYFYICSISYFYVRRPRSPFQRSLTSTRESSDGYSHLSNALACLSATDNLYAPPASMVRENLSANRTVLNRLISGNATDDCFENPSVIYRLGTRQESNVKYAESRPLTNVLYHMKTGSMLMFYL